MCGHTCCFQSEFIHNCAFVGLSLLMLSDLVPLHMQAPDQAFCRPNKSTFSLPASCKPCNLKKIVSWQLPAGVGRVSYLDLACED